MVVFTRYGKKMTDVTADIYKLIDEIKIDLQTKATTETIIELLAAINKNDELINLLEENISTLINCEFAYTKRHQRTGNDR